MVSKDGSIVKVVSNDTNYLSYLQCFDTVGWVIRPVKPVPDMTYNVFGGTLNLTQSVSSGYGSAKIILK